MSTTQQEDIKIRLVNKDDLESLIELDALLYGSERPDYWERMLTGSEEISRELSNSFIAEIKGTIVGVIIGELYMGRFGIQHTQAMLHTIGVHPDYQGQDIAKKLFDAFITMMKTLGVTTIQTLVKQDSALRRFFDHQGFQSSDTLCMEKLV